jgi:hypothetical protein
MALSRLQTDAITDLAVTNPKLAANSVNSAKIADGTVTGADIANNTVDVVDVTQDVLDGSLSYAIVFG